MSWIKRRVWVDLPEVIGIDLEAFLDLLSQRATGTELLKDISWTVEDLGDDKLIGLDVEGDDSECRPDGWKDALKPGDEVFWNDPDDGRCSGVCKIVDFNADGESVVLSRIEDSNSMVEAFITELS
jgi:hypothetical protein